MPLTPIEIRKKEFGRALRGWAPEEVREFLNAVAAEIEDLRRERAELSEKVEELLARIATYERTEKLLQDTLVTAQKATGELRESAERDARSIENDARLKAEQMLLDARRDADRIRGQVRGLTARRAALIHEIAAVARTYLSLAKSLESKPEDIEDADDSDEPADTAEPAGDPE